MHISDIANHLARRRRERGLKFTLGPPADQELVAFTEHRLGVHFPAQVHVFYSHYNGLKIDEPRIEILSLDELKFIGPNLLHFVTIDHDHQLSFDTSHLNEAGQWSILTNESGYRVTYTMASFWSNKIWNWVDKNRPIWRDWAPR